MGILILQFRKKDQDVEERFGKKTLGCTSPVLEYSQDKDTVIFLSDGKFHMEGGMIANPKHRFFKYDPYALEFILEEYDFPLLIKTRKNAITLVKPGQDITIGIIQGILGRQGSYRIVERIKKKCEDIKVKFTVILISEIFPDQLKLFGE